jgi:hypothetical protein
MTTINRPCLGCSKDFLVMEGAGSHKKLYCHRLYQVLCPICQDLFSQECRPKPKLFCSKSCSSIAINQSRRDQFLCYCTLCREPFQSTRSTAKHCGISLNKNCLGCGGSFDTFCGSRINYCNPSCRNSFMRATSYILQSKVCLYCGNSYTPASSGQLYCGHDFNNCQFCGQLFLLTSHQVRTIFQGTGKYCDNICSTLAQMNSKLDPNNISHYKDPRSWCLRFQQQFHRRPTSSDFEDHFQVRPHKMLEGYFSPLRRSLWEQKVIHHLDIHYPQLSYQRWFRMPSPDGGGRREGSLEIDIFFPSLGVGIEVQDLGTHSRDREEEQGKFGVKKGPRAHREKRERAQKMGYQIFEIWEDEIRANLLTFIIDQMLPRQLPELND